MILESTMFFQFRYKPNLIIAKLLISSLLTVGALPTLAADLQVNANGILTGAKNVNVDGIFYDVNFVDGSFVDAFGINGGSPLNPFVFSTEASAASASNALLEQVFIDVVGVGYFDSEPSRTTGWQDNGNSFNNGFHVTTPYSIFIPIPGGRRGDLLTTSASNQILDFEDIPQSGLYSDTGQYNPNNLGWDSSGPLSIPMTFANGPTTLIPPILGNPFMFRNYNIFNHSFAVWTTPVPEPSTYAMMGLGLFAIIGMRRSQQQA